LIVTLGRRTGEGTLSKVSSKELCHEIKPNSATKTWLKTFTKGLNNTANTKEGADGPN